MKHHDVADTRCVRIFWLRDKVRPTKTQLRFDHPPAAWLAPLRRKLS